MAKIKTENPTKKLLIVESPAKIKTISKFLGKDFTIMSTFGHVKDLPSKSLGVQIDTQNKTISIDYEVIKDKEAKVAQICKQASKSDEIYLASDPDREGEIIAWHISQEIAKVFKNKKKIYRISFNEITKQAVLKAIENKTIIDADKVAAQQARRVLDRWVGYQVSPILWKKITKGLSAGRVQSVALLLVCLREQEIKNFKPEESWSLHGTFTSNKAQLLADLVKIKNKAFKLKNKIEADKVLAASKKESYAIKEIKERKRKKNPLAPFMTSTLQQDAYNKLGFAVERTMKIAQRLYEGIPLSDKNPEALITYMRSDSLRIADSALKNVRSFIQNQYGNEYLPKNAIIYGKKGAQDAHEAIRPINVLITPDVVQRYANKDEAKLYDLIWKRFVACQMSCALYFMRQVFITGGHYVFKATGSTLIFDGFLKVYEIEDDEKSVNIPQSIQEHAALDLKKIESKQHFTQPPARYSEATLVKEMEKQGIGRPSTYSATLAVIQRRKYVDKEKKRFISTELGNAVNTMLVKNLPDIINISFTAQMEEDLDKIANKKAVRDTVLVSFYEKFEKELKAFGGHNVSKQVIKTDKKCSECKCDLVIRFGKSGQFLGCCNFPECTFTSNFERNEKGEIQFSQAPQLEKVDITCPQCSNQLVQKTGRYGLFLACPGYPECKYIHQESLNMPCPQCSNKVIKRRWRGGIFWGCAGYPKCRFAVFGDIQEIPCKKCTAIYMLCKKNKDGSTTLTCPEKECGHTQKES